MSNSDKGCTQNTGNRNVSVYCQFCGRTNKEGESPLQRCSRCRNAYFCDKVCFKSAWKQFHKFDCSRPPLSFEDQIDLEIMQSELSKPCNQEHYEFLHPVPLPLLIRAVERMWQGNCQNESLPKGELE